MLAQGRREFDGVSHLGFAHDDGVLLVIADSTGELHEVFLEDVASRQPSELSVMPDGMHTLISAKELTDLVEFLQGLGGSPAEGGGEEAEAGAEDDGRAKKKRKKRGR